MIGGHAVVKSLQKHRVKHVFCVAGESYLPVLDGLYDAKEIQTITCRHESGASFMADAYANLTGEVGVAMVTRGPGACNASIGIHSAMQASHPLVMFVGLVGTDMRDKEAFQEFDLKQMYGSLSKWQAVIDTPERIGEYVARAFHIAQEGRPGPVVLGLPEDVLTATLPKNTTPPPHIVLYNAKPGGAIDVTTMKEALEGAKKPFVIVGGSLWSDKECKALEEWAAESGVPVATSFRRQDIFNHNHDCYAGELGTGPNPKLVERVGQADVVLVLGARLTEITTQGYTLFKAGQKIIHVHESAAEFGKGVLPDIAVAARHVDVIAALDKISGGWQDWREAARADYEEWSAIGNAQNWGGADMTPIFAHIRESLPADAIITTDAGNFSGWCQRYLRYARPGRLLAPVSGAMGYAVPSAVAASIAAPDKTVVGFCGDGGFMMSAQELATASHHGAKPIIVVCNNGRYGTIAMHQERDFPDRPSATNLTNPDFVKLAESYGAFAARVESHEAFPDIWAEALKQNRPCIIEVKQDPGQVTTNSKA